MKIFKKVVDCRQMIASYRQKAVSHTSKIRGTAQGGASYFVVRVRGRLPHLLRRCRRRLKNALMPERHHFASKIGILFCRRFMLQTSNNCSGGRALVWVRGLELSRTHARRAPRMFSCGFKSRILLRKTEKFGIGSRNQLPSQQKENPHPNGHGFPFCGAGKRT